jgi:hypothetical protein
MQRQGKLGTLGRGILIAIPIDCEHVLFTLQIFDQMFIDKDPVFIGQKSAIIHLNRR